MQPIDSIEIVTFLSQFLLELYTLAQRLRNSCEKRENCTFSLYSIWICSNIIPRFTENIQLSPRTSVRFDRRIKTN